MKLLGKGIIEKFGAKHPNCKKAIYRWVNLVEGAILKTPQDIKKLFGNNVDVVGKQVIFDIGGNKVRAITKVQYGLQIIIVTHVLTHKEYDKNKWREK